MKFRLFAVYCATAISILVSEANARVLPRYIYNRAGNYYYYTVGTDSSTYSAKVSPARSDKGTITPEPYQKYVACIARTFLFENCTLCFCTDIPNVALCWDYEDEKCLQTQKLVDEQRNTTHNDPNGVW